MTESLEVLMSTLYGPAPPRDDPEDDSISALARRFLFSMPYTYSCIALVILNLALLAWVCTVRAFCLTQQGACGHFQAFQVALYVATFDS